MLVSRQHALQKAVATARASTQLDAAGCRWLQSSDEHADRGQRRHGSQMPDSIEIDHFTALPFPRHEAMSPGGRERAQCGNSVPARHNGVFTSISASATCRRMR